MAASADETRDGVGLTHLDQPLFEGAGVAKRDLVDYLDAVRDRILPVLRDRPLSVIRVHRRPGAVHAEEPAQVHPRVGRAGSTLWAEASKRDVTYALCDDRRTLLWFANQRAVEYHPTLSLADHLDRPTHLVLDLDPPEGAGFAAAAAAAHLVRAVLDEVGLAGAREDQRRQGRPRLRPRRSGHRRGGRRRGDPGHRRVAPSSSIPTWRRRPS